MKAQEIQEIRDQSLKEIIHARTFKNGKTKSWNLNEKMYYGAKTTTSESRANVDLGRMQEFVHTLLSKVNEPLVFKYTKRKESQLKRVQILNSLSQIDREKDNWDLKDLVAKKQCILYGRAIYSYSAADEKNVYKSSLQNIDVYDFLIDPSAGGIDVEKARYLGWYGVVKTRQELEAGIKSGEFIKDETTELLQGVGNNTEQPQNENDKRVRTQAQNTTYTQKELQDNDKFKFWAWITTYKGVRYYTLVNTNGRTIKVTPLTDMFESGLYPVFTYAAFPDLTEFWTPSFADYVREMFMVQNVSINQMLDNAEAINKPQKVVNVGALEDLGQLKYRRDGNIFTKGDYDANKVIQTLNVPSINTPIQVFNVLEGIQEKASGVTAGSKGVEDTTGKVGIYQGNQIAAADRFRLFNKSYSIGTQRFAKLYEYGVRENLLKRVAVQLIGPNGVEVKDVRRTDIFKKGDDYGVLVEASNQEVLVTIQEMQEKLKFLASQAQNPIQNPKKAYEISAKVAGFTPEDIRELLDTSEFGNSELMSEADRDLETLLAGDNIKPNKWANNAYKQRMVDYLKDHEEDIDMEQFQRIAVYIRNLDPIIIGNEVRAFNTGVVEDMNNQSAMMSGRLAAPTAPKNGVGMVGPNQINNNPII
jgi:DNA-binding transcriptional MerR regulator